MRSRVQMGPIWAPWATLYIGDRAGSPITRTLTTGEKRRGADRGEIGYIWVMKSTHTTHLDQGG